jgi:uncharacterized membrane protein YfcA
MTAIIAGVTTPILVHLVVVVFIATLIRSAVGFGEALIAVPLLAFRVPIEIAVPLAMLVSITVAGVIVAQDWRRIDFHSARWLLIATFFGLPIGLLFLKICNEFTIKCVLGGAIISFSIYGLIWRNKLHLKHDSRAWLLGCGFAAGIMGGAYGMNGPPLAIYGAMRRWSPQHFRATLQGYFLPASIIGMIGYWIAGLWTLTVTKDYLVSLPAILIAIWIGRAINNGLAGERFLHFVYILLIGIGIALLMQAIY